MSDTITLEARALAKAMKHAAAIAETRNTIPILANVRLIADGDTLEIASSDLDVEFRQRVPLKQAGALAATVDARRLFALAGASDPGAQLSLAPDGGRLTVKSGRSRWQLPVLPVEHFPSMPWEQPFEPVRLNGRELGEAISRTAPSISAEASRPYLCGALLNPEAGHLRLTSTDGHRGIYVDLAAQWPNGAPDFLVGSKFLLAMRALGEDAEVLLSWTRNMMRAEVGTASLTGKAIEQPFPDYRRVWPGDSKAPVRVDPGSLRAALRRVGLVAAEKTRAVKIERCDGLLRLSVTSPEGGTAVEEVPAECAAGFECGFNAAYLAAMAEAVGGETLEIHHAGPGDVAKFVRLPRDGAVGVVMPMRV